MSKGYPVKIDDFRAGELYRWHGMQVCVRTSSGMDRSGITDNLVQGNTLLRPNDFIMLIEHVTVGEEEGGDGWFDWRVVSTGGVVGWVSTGCLREYARVPL